MRHFAARTVSRNHPLYDPKGNAGEQPYAAAAGAATGRYEANCKQEGFGAMAGGWRSGAANYR